MRMEYDKYYNLKQFIDDIKEIGEIIFRYGKKEYSLNYDGEKVYIAESFKQETERVFDSIELFLNEFTCEGEKIKDIIKELKIVFH